MPLTTAEGESTLWLAAELEAWLDVRVLGGFDVLAMDPAAFREWGRLMRGCIGSWS